jgi:site-specific recombinase XerD
MPFAVPAVIHDPTLPAALGAELASAADLARLEKADATRRAYGSDWRMFQSYCDERGTLALPAAPETVAAFLAWEDGRGSKPSTIGRRVAAVLYAHKLAGLASPTDDERVKAVMRGIRLPALVSKDRYHAIWKNRESQRSSRRRRCGCQRPRAPYCSSRPGKTPSSV